MATLGDAERAKTGLWRRRRRGRSFISGITHRAKKTYNTVKKKARKVVKKVKSAVKSFGADKIVVMVMKLLPKSLQWIKPIAIKFLKGDTQGAISMLSQNKKAIGYLRNKFVIPFLSKHLLPRLRLQCVCQNLVR